MPQDQGTSTEIATTAATAVAGNDRTADIREEITSLQGRNFPGREGG